MKKQKMKEQEDILRKNQDKTSDNKENTAASGDNGVASSAEAASDETIKREEANEAAEGMNSAINDSYVKVVEGKLAETQDKYVRLSAEFDNYRKRTLREKIDLSKYAGEKLLLNILPMIDDFERALQHIDTSADHAAIKDGIDLIYGKFIEFLKQNNVTEIEAMNCNFNVDIHEAVAKVPVDEDKKGKVVDVVLKGYYLQDKVLRFAKVVVGE